MDVRFILATSIVLQLSAAILALRLIRITGWKLAWTLIALAISLMTARRIISVAQSKEALHFTQFAVDHAADSVFWVTLDAKFFYVNEAACRALGYTREEMLTMTVHDIAPDFSSNVWPDTWTGLKEQTSATFESHHRTKDGRIFPVEITANFQEYEGQEYLCAFARDITDRKNAEQALRDAHDGLSQPE